MQRFGVAISKIFEKKDKFSFDHRLPSLEEMYQIIETAKIDAVLSLKKMGIDAMHFECDCKLSNNTKINEDDEDVEIEECDEESDVRQDMHTLSTVLSTVTGILALKNYSASYSESGLNETSPFTLVSDASGADKIVRKSSICWLLTKNKSHFSSDRLQRVKDIDIVKSNIRNMKTNNQPTIMKYVLASGLFRTSI